MVNIFLINRIIHKYRNGLSAGVSYHIIMYASCCFDTEFINACDG